ncbi:MAG: DNA phosphorothioation-associated putative methyltransferase [Proteobacteria bacterium]|jgi:DNA phosphorothioation-associated putative methyltransferase|nr:DNA phosphorothioation-associated putative methyltransferase [Pseudomonadota bacterium]
MNGRPSTQAGKKVGGALYIHTSALKEADETHLRAVEEGCKIACLSVSDFNVVKLQKDKVSLLLYEEFSEVAFPALLESHSVDLPTQRVISKSYRNSKNPPILHRKELLLRPDDKQRVGFLAVTKELEGRGLFHDSRMIGHRRQWEERLEKAGVTVQGAEVIFENGSEKQVAKSTIVHRHRTAISRQGLSAPLQALVRNGLLIEDASVFDFGCGQGDDLATLRSAGINASGWDPHFFPDAELKQADIVNLGFVLNVIESAEERVEAVRKAFSLVNQLLTVAVMLPTQGRTESLRPHNDGYLTSRGTFQKYFAQSEIKSFLENTLEQEAIALAPGVFVVFRDKILEQGFLSNRHRRARDISQLLTLLEGRTGSSGDRDSLLIDEHSDLLKQLWGDVLQLGRLPDPEELDAELFDNIQKRLGSIRTAVRLAQTAFGSDALKEARAARIDDLRVYFALNLFSQRKQYSSLPRDIQRDVKAFFGSYTNAVSAGKELLFSVGDPSNIQEACKLAADQGIGHLESDRSLQFDARLNDRLPALLRVYIGCGEVLHGDASESDIVKIHIHSGKISLLQFEGYRELPIPRLRERVKIRLRDQDIDFYEYGGEYPSPPLYLKSRFMASDQTGYKKQKKFDDQLSELGELDFSGYGPTIEELQRVLLRTKKKISGFSILDGNVRSSPIIGQIGL